MDPPAYSGGYSTVHDLAGEQKPWSGGGGAAYSGGGGAAGTASTSQDGNSSIEAIIAELAETLGKTSLVDLIEEEDIDEVLSDTLKRLKVTTPKTKEVLVDVKALSFVYRFKPTRRNYFKWDDAGTTLVVKLRPLVADLGTAYSKDIPLSIENILEMVMEEIHEKDDQLETFALEGLTDLEDYHEMGPFKAGESANKHAIIDIDPLLHSLSHCRHLKRVVIWACTLPPIKEIRSLMGTMLEVLPCWPHLKHFSLLDMTFCEYDADGNNPALLTTRTEDGKIIDRISGWAFLFELFGDSPKSLHKTRDLQVQFTTQAIYEESGKQKFSDTM